VTTAAPTKCPWVARELAKGRLDPANEYRFRLGWKCLDGGTETMDDDGALFPTLEAAKTAAKLADYDPGLGRRVILADVTGQLYRKSFRVRLGPDYMPYGHGTGWGLW
jgi:hypothetical protein